MKRIGVKQQRRWRIEIEINSRGTGFLSYVSESVELRGKEAEHVHANYYHWLGLVSAA
jgi:hypothetical protein